MNNEEKKPISGEAEPTVDTSANTVDAPEAKTGGGWWNSLAQNVKIAIIAGVSCLLVAVIVLVAVLAIGGKDSGDGGGTGDGGTGDVGDGGENENPDANVKVDHSITVTTKGGMKLSGLAVYFHAYEDGDISDMLAYTVTDENGKATVSLPKGGSYAAKIDNDIPEGYDVDEFYPLVSTDFEITITSSLLPDNGHVGVKYSLGSVMHDFSATTTTGEIFTLSEALKEKKAVLINFWYTDCTWCITEFPLMQAAYELYKDDLAIIALDPPETASADTLDDIRLFQDDLGLTFDMAQDLEGLNRAFGVAGYPMSVIVDRYGVVTFIEPGAIVVQREFEEIFRFFTADDYKQTLVTNKQDIIPREKPNVQMPSGEEISNVFDGGKIPGIEYLPYPEDASDDEKEYSWPFIIDQVELGGEIFDVIKTSNANKVQSYAQLIINVDLKAGDVLAFDYFASTERGADILYVVVDGKDIYSISGQNATGWETRYAYVAEEDATYEVGLVYAKDSSEDEGDDTVYLKDLRIISEAEIDSDTYIYRFAATKPNPDGSYGKYAEIFPGTDGYYHVGSSTGPILLADLMGYTRFNGENSAYYMAADLLAAEKLTPAQYDLFIDYCSYASNSNIYGVSSVTEELRQLLLIFSENFGDPLNENDWLRFCCYYDSYGPSNKELEDPIKGLALFSAYDVIVSDKGATDFPNSFVYNKVIMPRGLLAKFTPTVSGTYLISSYAPDPNKEGYGLETNAWVFTANGFADREVWYTYENVDRLNTSDVNNCYMILYLEAGKDYYIDIAFYDVYQEGTIYFRVERLGDEGFYRFSQTSPGPFTARDNELGELTETIIISIPVELGNDGFWHEKRDDGRLGSIIYADFTQTTPIFTGNVIYYDGDDPKRIDMIEAGAFNFKYTAEDLYVLNYLEKVGGDVERCKAELLAELGEAYNNTYNEDDYNGGTYSVTGYAVEEVLAGIYHGKGNDETETMREYASKRIKVGDVITTVSQDGLTVVEEVIQEGDPRIGCVAVDERLSDILQLLMDKYTFEGVKNSWLKLCYYEQFFNAATPK
ncbi:MAG: TlpA family protein disulfide reductase [Clostridia bacterium]|nr:TlpA family protein disulfide reductase [Clostridia bacterium]